MSKDSQLNIRLDQASRTLLDAAAFVRGMTTTQLMQSLAEDAAAKYELQPAVKKALQAREEQRLLDEGKLAHLRPAGESSADQSP
jgi:uncharacterized protein (DUF1778 family)